jgi:hypothetical protein
MPGPSNMELRRSSQQARPQDEQPEQRITDTTATGNEVKTLRRQLQDLQASRDAEIDQQTQLVATPRQRWEPAPRIPVPQMEKLDGSTPVSEWWTTFMAYNRPAFYHRCESHKAIAILFTHLDASS